MRHDIGHDDISATKHWLVIRNEGEGLKSIHEMYLLSPLSWGARLRQFPNRGICLNTSTLETDKAILQARFPSIYLVTEYWFERKSLSAQAAVLLVDVD